MYGNLTIKIIEQQPGITIITNCKTGTKWQ